MNILLMGYYGKRNLGDDLFVQQLSSYFSKLAAVEKIFILCDENYYQGLSDKAILIASNRASKLRKVLTILQSDRIAWGGGTLNLGGESRSLMRFQQLARLTGKKLYFLGVGLEGISEEAKASATKLIHSLDLLYLRDRHSYDAAVSHFSTSCPRYLGGDLAFLDLSIYEKFVQQKTDKGLAHISVSGKFWWGEGRGEFYAQQLLPLIEKYNCTVHLLPAHGGTERNDNQFHKFVQRYLPASNCQLHAWQPAEQYIETLSQMDFHIGNRLHSLILADILGVPNIGIGEVTSKLGHYIEKTEMLSNDRIVSFMEPISVEKIEKIAAQYQRPEQFILSESQTARDCLDKIFLNP